jgi:hypothetical protein
MHMTGLVGFYLLIPFSGVIAAVYLAVRLNSRR